MVFHGGAGSGDIHDVNCNFDGAPCTEAPDLDRVLTGNDVTLMAGITFGAGPVLFGIRYDLGLSDLNDFSGGPETRTRTFLFTLSYRLPTGN